MKHSAAKYSKKLTWLGSKLELLTGEVILDYYPNGGTVIFCRAILMASLFSITNALVDFFIDITGFSAPSILPYWWQVFVAVFATTYTALYTRFASQFSYLANLYNQIQASYLRIDPDNKLALERIKAWEAGFVEDADSLHLATKPIFAATINAFLDDPVVVKYYKEYTIGGELRFPVLKKEVENSMNSHKEKILRKYGEKGQVWANNRLAR